MNGKPGHITNSIIETSLKNGSDLSILWIDAPGPDPVDDPERYKSETNFNQKSRQILKMIESSISESRRRIFNAGTVIDELGNDPWH